MTTSNPYRGFRYPAEVALVTLTAPLGGHRAILRNGRGSITLHGTLVQGATLTLAMNGGLA